MVCPHLYCRKIINDKKLHELAEWKVFRSNISETFYFKCPFCKKIYSIYYYKIVNHWPPETEIELTEDDISIFGEIKNG